MANEAAAKKREKTILRTSLLGIAGNILLVAGKASIGIIAGSISIILDALNNLTDILSSAVTMIGTKIAAKKPDKKHPYGHGRSEYLASLIVGIIVLAAGALALYESIKGIVEDPLGKKLPEYSIPMLVLIGVGVLVKVFLGLYFRKMGKATNSEALKGSGTDALFDALLSFSTLVGALISFLAGVSIENYLGALIGAFIIRAGIMILIQSYSLLIGERSDKADSQALRKKIASYPEVKGVFDMLLHNYGPSRQIGSAHIEVRDDMTAKEIHDLTRRIITDVYLDTGIILTLGIYSSNDSSPQASKMKESLTRIIRDYPHVLQIHGFYYREEDKMVSADLIIDFEEENPDGLIEEIKAKFVAEYPDYTIYIVRDLDFSD